MVQSCHMPEFTDHGLPHLCSLVDRLSLWEGPDGKRVESGLNFEECGTLLLATLIHDLGMLSQNQADMPDDAPAAAALDQAVEIGDWVCRTHVHRLRKLAARVLRDDHEEFVVHPAFSQAVDVASAHQRWPWQWAGPWQQEPRQRGLAALVAVADLLDEDAARCDTTTLLRHREGNALNRAHWLRHGLTSNRLLVQGSRISVNMHRPPGTDTQLLPVFGALRNHFRLVSLYAADLQSVGAEIQNIHFDTCTGIPAATNLVLTGWDQLPEYANAQALCVHLLRSFMPEALRDVDHLSPGDLTHLRRAALEDVDLAPLQAAHPGHEPGTDIEHAFHAIAGA